MARPKKDLYGDVLKGLREKVERVNIPTEARKIPSIIEFVESPDYLGIGSRSDEDIRLFPMQRLMLKAFYRGSEGNDGPDIRFNDEELEVLRKHELTNNDRGDVLGKVAGDTVFRELVLVWGRRSGKDFIISIIALYEAMKLLESPGGCPYVKYNLPRGGNPITILTVATAAPQALIAFNEMKSKLLQSKYFKDKFIPEGLQSGSISLLTPKDRLENEDRRKRGLQPEKGGVVIRAGHSNSDSLLGIQCFVLLMDEVASFRDTEGSSGGRRVYEAMLPSLNTFIRDEVDKNTGEYLKDELGRPVKVFDSKVISISSPRGKKGILWEMFSEADGRNSSGKYEHPERLVCRLPTWVVNIKYTRESLRKTFSQFSDESFMMEFGADFSATAGMNFFIEDNVHLCVRHAMRFKERGEHGIVYFAHLDPATTGSNRYVLAIVHKEIKINTETRRAEAVVVLDHLRIFQPDPKTGVRLEDVDNYMLKMNLMFHLGLVTYDDCHSQASVQKLRKAGIPCKVTKYTKQYKMQVYNELEQLVNDKRIYMPHDDLLVNEMVYLQRRYDSGRGYSVMADKEAECNTDDCTDALAGAVYNCLATTVSKLPQSKLVSMPSTPQGANHLWMSMQGVPYGYGSGAFVGRHMRGPSSRGF